MLYHLPFPRLRADATGFLHCADYDHVTDHVMPSHDRSYDPRDDKNLLRQQETPETINGQTQVYPKIRNNLVREATTFHPG